MNYLAHIFLAERNDEAMLGALLGDFVKADVTGGFSRRIEVEIRVHRKIDCFTDSHRVVAEGRRMFAEGRRRYAGIALDVFYDHLLASNWSDYGTEPLSRFTGRFYDALTSHKEILPANLVDLMPWMIKQDWLGSYRDFSGVETAICRISERLSRNGHLLRDGLLDLRANYAALRTGFEVFFPELMRFAGEARAELEPPSFSTSTRGNITLPSHSLNSINAQS